MSRGDKWRGNAVPAADWRNNSRAYDVARLIAAKSISITIRRSDPDSATSQKYIDLAAQTVRIDPIDNVPFERFAYSDVSNVNGVRMLLIGYKNHPTITDTDVAFGDRFTYEDQVFEVLQIQPGYTDRTIAIVEAVD